LREDRERDVAFRNCRRVFSLKGENKPGLFRPRPDVGIVSPGTEAKFSDRRERSILPLAPEAAPATFDSHADRRVRALVSCDRERDYPRAHDSLSLSPSFRTRAPRRVSPDRSTRAFLIKLEHPPLRNYEASLIVPARIFTYLPVVSAIGLSLGHRSIADNDQTLPRNRANARKSKLQSPTKVRLLTLSGAWNEMHR